MITKEFRVVIYEKIPRWTVKWAQFHAAVPADHSHFYEGYWTDRSPAYTSSERKHFTDEEKMKRFVRKLKRDWAAGDIKVTSRMIWSKVSDKVVRQK